MIRDAMASILLQFNSEPSPEWFAQAKSAVERLEAMQRFYSLLKARLRKKLSEYQVQIVDLDSLGAVVVTGSAEEIACLTRPGELDSFGVTVAEEADFVPLD